MSTLSFLKLTTLGIVLSFAQLSFSQTMAKPAHTDQLSPRQAYLQKQEAFAKRLNLTASQKEAYQALVEKRNAALSAPKLNSDQSTAQLEVAKTTPKTKRQILADFDAGFQALLTPEQRSIIEAEKKAVVLD